MQYRQIRSVTGCDISKCESHISQIINKRRPYFTALYKLPVISPKGDLSHSPPSLFLPRSQPSIFPNSFPSYLTLWSKYWRCSCNYWYSSDGIINQFVQRRSYASIQVGGNGLWRLWFISSRVAGGGKQEKMDQIGPCVLQGDGQVIRDELECTYPCKCAWNCQEA